MCIEWNKIKGVWMLKIGYNGRKKKRPKKEKMNVDTQSSRINGEEEFRW